MVGIFPPEKELVEQRDRIKEAANSGPSRVAAVDRLVQDFGYGRHDATVIVDRFRIKTADDESPRK